MQLVSVVRMRDLPVCLVLTAFFFAERTGSVSDRHPNSNEAKNDNVERSFLAGQKDCQTFYTFTLRNEMHLPKRTTTFSSLGQCRIQINLKLLCFVPPCRWGVKAPVCFSGEMLVN